MKNNNSIESLYGWFDVSTNLDGERNWIHKYIELNQRRHTLTFHSSECIRTTDHGTKQIPRVDLNCEILSMSSSSSLSSLYKSNERRSSMNTLQPNSIVEPLSERISPSLSKTILSSSMIADEKIIDIHSPLFTDRPSSINTTRQSRIKFSHFFGRSSNHTEYFLPSLKRTKSATKLERHKKNTQNQLCLLDVSSNRSRSHESLFVLNGPLGSILPSKPAQIMLDNYHIRCLHPSILPSSDLNNTHSLTSYQYIEMQNENKTCYLRSKENSLLLKYLQRSYLKKTNDHFRIDNSLDIWILEAKGFLPIKKKYCVKIFLDDDIYGKTTSIEKRDGLFWGENFIFKDLPEGCSILRCKIYSERRKQNQYDLDLIGSIDIPLSTISGNQFIEQWYSLQILNNKEKIQDRSIHIRLKTKYQTIRILSSDAYLPFQQYLRQNYLRLIQILEPHISLRDKDEIATSLTRIAQFLSCSISYLVDIIQAEISSTADNSLTFRGNSIATKSMEAYMKLTGDTYLRETLTHFIIDIVSLKTFNEIDLEVDPNRISNIEYLEKNQITLRLLCEQIWIQIQQSHTSFPHELKYIFWKLRQLSSSDETMLNLISGSVFLRFLCPAILSPNLFGLTQEYPGEKTSRKLTLIAKTLQTLANFSKFGSKESYMNFMNDFVSKESDNMRKFLINISTIDSNGSELITEDIDLGRECSILHTILANLFKELDLNIRQSLNELESILNGLSLKISEILKQNYSITSSNHSSLYGSQSSLSETTKDHYFNENLFTESSSKQLIDHSNNNDRSLPQSSITSSNSHIRTTTHSSISSNNNPLLMTTTKKNSDVHFLTTNEEATKTQRQQPVLPNQQSPPKMGIKAISSYHLNKDSIYSQRFPMFKLYQEEKYRRIHCEKQVERFHLHESDV